MKIFAENLQNLIGRRFDPEFVAFSRRQASFKHPQVTLGRLLSARPEYGAAESGVQRESIEEVRYVRITDIDENGDLSSDLGATAENIEKKYLLSHGDLLFARSGNTVGKCYCHDTQLVPYPCIYAGYLIRYRFSDLVLPRFVFAVSQTAYFQDWVLAVRRAAGQPNINAQEFSNLAIPLPPLDVQRKIVAELDEAYAAKRAADQNAADLLRSIDDMVLEELGIENVELKDGSLADRIFITNAAQLAGMTLSPAHYYQQIDFGSSKYACLRIGEIAEIDPVISCAEQKTYQFIAMDGVSAERGEVENVEVRSGETNGYSVFGNGDVIFAKITPCMENGKSAVVENVNGVVYGSTEFMVLRMRDTRILPGYLHLILRLRQFREVAACHFTGSAGHQRVDKKFVAQLPIPVPPAFVQDRIVRKSKAMKAEARKLKAEAAAKLESAKRRIEEELMG